MSREVGPGYRNRRCTMEDVGAGGDVLVSEWDAFGDAYV